VSPARDSGGHSLVLLCLVAAELFAHTPEADTAAESQAGGQELGRLRSFIREHLHDPGLTPSTVARANHISRSRLHRLFRAQGTTVAAWIRNERLKRARRDLADPAMRETTIQRIATRHGFTHQAAFSRSFRKAYGFPPREYRRRALASLRDAN
jgi:AraC-like DNA-binding protein